MIANIIRKVFVNEEEVNGAFSLVSKREYTKVNSEKHETLSYDLVLKMIGLSTWSKLLTLFFLSRTLWKV